MIPGGRIRLPQQSGSSHGARSLQLGTPGRPMRGLVTISNDGFRSAASLRKWVGEAVQYTGSLPAKKKKKK